MGKFDAAIICARASPTPVDIRIFPNTPPAPVTRIINPHGLKGPRKDLLDIISAVPSKRTQHVIGHQGRYNQSAKWMSYKIYPISHRIPFWKENGAQRVGQDQDQGRQDNEHYYTKRR